MANDESLEGEDTDQNGLRDDLQYYVNMEAREDIVLRELLAKTFKLPTEKILNLDDEQVLVEKETKLVKMYNCLEFYVTDKERLETISILINTLTYNNQIRDTNNRLSRYKISGYPIQMLYEINESNFTEACRGE